MSQNVITITQLVGYMKRQIDQDVHLRKLMVSGEVSNFTRHRSGHFYFSLKDNNAKMNCVMFKSYASHVSLDIKEGMKVIVTCSVSMYEAAGSIQLYVNDIQSDGLGDLYLAFEQLKEKLHKQGLFDESHKKEIPTYPMSIGVISAKTGAAIQDVLSIMKRRWPVCEVVLYPSLVQGVEASKDIIKNLTIADTKQHDLILLVRGGGSIEDLWCFNDELLAQTIYNMNTCVVSGVGHEIDTTLVDYVSDSRAPTPSAAAELVTPNIQDVEFQLASYTRQLDMRIQTLFDNSQVQLQYIKEKPYFKDSNMLFKDIRLNLMMKISQLSSMEVYTQKKRQLIQHKGSYLSTVARDIVNKNKQKTKLYSQELQHNLSTYKDKQVKDIKQYISLLDAYSPLKILERGYSITSKDDDTIISSIHDVTIGDNIQIRVSDGNIHAQVVKERVDGNE